MRYLVRTSPFREIDAWQKAFDRFFSDDVFGARPARPSHTSYSPALDVLDDENSLQVEASLPGFSPDQVEISVHDGVLTIKGDLEQLEEQEESGKYYLRERRYGAFQRAIRLPVDVDADAAEAVFENGVLNLTLPKVEAAKPKRITVKAS